MNVYKSLGHDPITSFFCLSFDLLCQPKQVLNFFPDKVSQLPFLPGDCYSFSIKLCTSPAKEQMFLLEQHEM